jgi:hypothetical protein
VNGSFNIFVSGKEGGAAGRMVLLAANEESHNHWEKQFLKERLSM